MRSRLLYVGLMAAALYAGVPGANSAQAQDVGGYIQNIAADMVAISRRPTADRRAFYNKFLAGEVDWNGPAILALGRDRWSSLPEADRQRLADWARDALMGYESAMRFIQNLIFQSCSVSGGKGSTDAGVHISCTRFASEGLFGLRFDVAKQGDRFKIADIGYIGISLREQLAKEIFQKDAIEEHGVRVDLAELKK